MSQAERQALTQLYDRYGRSVRARCRALCGNDADADEALQETFLRAWRFRSKFDGRNPLGWLHRVAYNASIDVLRKRGRHPLATASIEALADALIPDHPSSQASMFLGQFQPVDAAILRLRHIEEWDLDDIADQVGSSRRSISRRLQRLEHRARALILASEAS